MKKSEKEDIMTKMSMPTLLCRCSAELSPNGWSDHQHRYHASKPGYACPDCEFSSQSLSDTVGHACLEGHRMGGVKVSNCRKLLATVYMSGNAKQTSGPAKLELKMEAVEDPVGSEEEDINDPPPAVSLCPIAAPNATFVLKVDGSKNAAKKAALLSSACQICGKVIRLSHHDPRGKALKHVLGCLDIRQYACSRCRLLSARADHIWRHIAAVCPGASLVEVEKEWCQAKGRLGLRICFPQLGTMVTSRVGNGSKHCLTRQDPEGLERVRDDEQNLVPADSANLDPKEPELSEEEEPEDEAAPVEQMSLKQPQAEDLSPPYRELLEEEKMPPANSDYKSSQGISCSICGNSVKWRKGHQFGDAARHVHSCLNIRPFACSNCGQRSSRAAHVRRHIGRQCPGAKVEMVEKEKCQSELREGLQRCFPEENFAFRD